MITYYAWKACTEELTYYSTVAEKISEYAFFSFISVFSIALDSISLPFQLTGLLIYMLTNRKR